MNKDNEKEEINEVETPKKKIIMTKDGPIEID